jgi:hypothetical protein
MSAGHVSSDFDLIFHGLQTLLNLRKVFVIMSVSPYHRCYLKSRRDKNYHNRT